MCVTHIFFPRLFLYFKWQFNNNNTTLHEYDDNDDDDGGAGDETSLMKCQNHYSEITTNEWQCRSMRECVEMMMMRENECVGGRV